MQKLLISRISRKLCSFSRFSPNVCAMIAKLETSLWPMAQRRRTALPNKMGNNWCIGHHNTDYLSSWGNSWLSFGAALHFIWQNSLPKSHWWRERFFFTIFVSLFGSQTLVWLGIFWFEEKNVSVKSTASCTAQCEFSVVEVNCFENLNFVRLCCVMMGVNVKDSPVRTVHVTGIKFEESSVR